MGAVPARFEDILDHCITAMREGSSLDDCLEAYPAHQEALEPLLKVAAGLEQGRALTAPPEFRRVAATRMSNLVAARPRRPAQVSPKTRRFLPFHLAPFSLGLQDRLSFKFFFTVILLLAFLSTGVVVASAQALPGEAFYPVKTGFENFQLRVSQSEIGDSRLMLVFANRRLDEVIRLVEKDRSEYVHAGLTRYTDQVATVLAIFAAGEGLTAAERAELANGLVASLDRHAQVLADLWGQMPLVDRDAVQIALDASLAARAVASQVLNETFPRPLVLPGGASSTAITQPDASPTATPQPPVAQTGWSTGWATVYPTRGERTAFPDAGRDHPLATRLATYIPTEWLTALPSDWATQRPRLSTLRPTRQTERPLRTPRPEGFPTRRPDSSAWPTQWPTQGPAHDAWATPRSWP